MFAPEEYFPLFMNCMLAITLVAAIFYAQGATKPGMAVGFNSFMIWPFATLLILFIGFRPTSGVFVDMLTYAESYNMAANGISDIFPDWGFNKFIELCARVMEVKYFFLTCACLYIVPLWIGLTRVHRGWAFAAFLVFVGALQFFSYAVNGIRNGISCSLLIAAFAFWDRKIVMAALMIAAASMHKSALLPATAFIVAGFYASPAFYSAIWAGCFLAVMALGERLANFATSFISFGNEDERLSIYVQGAGFGGDKGGFRLDFVLYSIVPVCISWALATHHTRNDPLFRRLTCAYLLANAFWVVMMYAAQSNRFAYMSWFMMPWIIVYPFLPTEAPSGNMLRTSQGQSRTEILPAAIIASIAFTYVMTMFIYKGAA